MKRLGNGLAAGLLLSLVPVVGQADPDPQQDIETAIQNYQDGFNNRDCDLLNQAFDAPNAHMKSLVKKPDEADSIKVTAIEDWIARACAEGEPRDAEITILSITMVNDHIANVFLDFDNVLFDMMLVAEIDGDWKILNKVSIYKNPDQS